MGTSGFITLCYLRSQGLKLLRRCLGRVLWSRQLSFANGMHHFKAGNRTARRPKRLKAQHRVSEPFHGSMILLHHIIEILGVTDGNRGLVRLIVARDSRRVTATLIDSNFLREPLGANGLV